MTIGLIPLLHEWGAATDSFLCFYCSPDYQKLTELRALYPKVPIIALSATCPLDVLRDLISILRLPPPTDGRGTVISSHGGLCSLSHLDAVPGSTVKFTSPLYRRNLQYKIISKPSTAALLVRDMMNYILECHADETGIIYCLSRKVSDPAQTLIGVGHLGVGFGADRG